MDEYESVITNSTYLVIISSIDIENRQKIGKIIFTLLRNELTLVSFWLETAIFVIVLLLLVSFVHGTVLLGKISNIPQQSEDNLG